MDSVKVEKVTLDIKGAKIDLTIEEARALMESLKGMFGDKEYIAFPYPHPAYPYYPTPQSPYYTTWERDTNTALITIS